MAAIAYIETNLGQALNLNLIAKHCHFSSFHFHRIFKGAMNETLNSYIGRKRLEKAVHLLVFNKNISITHIALDCGFSSSANFAKAVKKYFGYSPSNIRSPQFNQQTDVGDILHKYGKEFNPNHLYPSQAAARLENQLNVAMVAIAQKRLCKLTSQGGYETESLFNTWDSLSQWGECHGISKVEQYRIAWCYDNPAVTPINKCRYDASIEVSNETNIVEPFSASSLPAGDYAVLYVKGSAEDITQAQMSLFGWWLPNSGYEPDDLPMLERYLNDVRVDGFIESEIMIKLQALK